MALITPSDRPAAGRIQRSYVLGAPDESEGREVEQAWREKHMACLEAADLVVVGVEAAARALSERGFGGKVTVVAPGVDVHAYDWWPSAPGHPHRVLLGAVMRPTRILRKAP